MLVRCHRLITLHPFKAGVAITTLKTVTADLVVQKFIEQQEWDARRTALFGLFGCIYQGGVQYYLVNGLIEPLFPGRNARNVCLKILSMNLVADPVLFLPTFYCFKEVLVERKVNLDIVAAALSRYYENCFTDWFNTWSVWFPGHAVTYAVCPPAFRIPWMSFVSFGYVGVLSFTRGQMMSSDAQLPEQTCNQTSATICRSTSSVAGMPHHTSGRTSQAPEKINDSHNIQS